MGGMHEPVYVTFARPSPSGKGFASGCGKGPYGDCGKGQEPPVTSSEKILVQDIPADCDENRTKETLGQYGTVVSLKLLPSQTIGEKRCAVVELDTVETAQWFVDNLNGQIPRGWLEPVAIRFAK